MPNRPIVNELAFNDTPKVGVGSANNPVSLLLITTSLLFEVITVIPPVPRIVRAVKAPPVVAAMITWLAE